MAGSTETLAQADVGGGPGGPVGLVAGDGEREVGVAGRADVLDDHVDEDVGLGDLAEDRGGVARPVGDVEQGDPRLALVELDAGDHQVFHPAGRGAGGRATSR